MCGQGWSSCTSNQQVEPRTCDEICGVIGGIGCFPNGCAGHTALFFASSPFAPARFPDILPYDEFDGGCDELLLTSGPEPDEFPGLQVMCCCGPV